MANKTKKMIFSALFASLACVLTMFPKVPAGPGYVNLGDSVVLLSGWMLGPLYGFFASAVGTAMADVFSGYAIYAPATFVIKGLMAIAAYGLSKKTRPVFGALVAEVIMISGYYVYEGFLYGFGPSLLNIPANAVQGAASIVVGLLLLRVFKKGNIL